MFLNTLVEPNGAIFDGLNKHADNGIGKLGGPAQSFFQDTTQLHQSATVNLGVVHNLTVYLLTDLYKHFDDSVGELDGVHSLLYQVSRRCS